MKVICLIRPFTELEVIAGIFIDSLKYNELFISIHLISNLDNPNEFKDLIEKGADVNMKDKDDYSILHLAALLGNY